LLCVERVKLLLGLSAGCRRLASEPRGRSTAVALAEGVGRCEETQGAARIFSDREFGKAIER
jgi:hypothetical protein